MNTFKEASLLRVFVDESDKLDGFPLYENIVLKARKLNLTGATVIRGIAGFGAHNLIHSSKILDMSHNLPVIIEIIDQKENLEHLLSYLSEVVKEGLITLEDIKIMNLKR
ncbi:MAG: DUF190 domain-containing protein [Spirochaetia bacterium]|nr:DUF190 domain-containing protein [Spirochaetia bacterium]